MKETTMVSNQPEDRRGGLADVGDAQSAPRAPKHSALSDSSSWLPIRQLVDQWRKRRVEATAKAMYEMSGTYRICADELESALAALLDPAPQLSENKDVDTPRGRGVTMPTTGSTAPSNETRFHMAEMTPAEAGKFVRNMAEMTAMNSQNWENFEAICVSMITSAMEAGRAFGRKEAPEASSPSDLPPRPTSDE